MAALERINFRQIRDFAELINITFLFLRQNFMPLGKCLIFIVGPILLIAAVYAGYTQEKIAHLQKTMDFSAFTTTYSISTVITLFVASLFAAVVYHYVKLYIENDQVNFDVNDVWQAAKGDVLRFIAVSFIFGVIVTVGAIFCLIPGIYLAVAFSLVYVTLTQERLGIFGALSRSKELVAGYWWATLGLVIVLTMIQFILSMIFYVPTILVGALSEFHRVDEAVQPSRLLVILTTLIASFGGYLFHSISLIGLSFHYHNLVERKEATGLMGEIDEIGA